MREILFRGKRLDNGEWVEGYFMPRPNNPGGSKTYIVTVGRTVWCEVDPETVCQFTGLTDKNGVKIWENDICKCILVSESDIQEFVSKLEWDHYEWVFITDNCGYPLCNFDNSLNWLSHDSEIEVIGNIFDNPELMEGGAV